jgi:hypothetical protein
MNEAALSRALRDFSKRNQVTLAKFGSRQSQLLEIAGLFTAAQHYRANGYQVAARNLQNRLFRAKVTTSPYPQRYSYFEASRAGTSFEIHSNMPVRGAYALSNAAFVVDVAVIKAGQLPPANVKYVATQQQLMTFAEVKSLVTYPMLLAQFVGIVHEITPKFLSGRVPSGFRRDQHFTPALITVNHLTPASRQIVDSFLPRGYRIQVLPGLDNYVARHGWAAPISPLA